MDYSKSGNPRSAKDGHNHKAGDQSPRGAPNKPSAEAKKAELLARMKAAAEARKQG